MREVMRSSVVRKLVAACLVASMIPAVAFGRGAPGGRAWLVFRSYGGVV
jgi:hypothetical protein